ncbi:TPA: hypothetical protein O7X93_003913 [Salmonella enterica]|nr:hypothetical protein [Salmonella enterica]EMD2852725.1 hypothetical protein [Salmonella enterica]HDC2139069.1 hypothetical protein [Salmonella enterica]
MDNVKYTRLHSPGLLRPHLLAPEVLQQKFREYGFVECSTLIAFIDLFYIPYPDHSGLHYILCKTEECLRNHDNGSDYFSELRCIVHNTRDFLNSGIQEGEIQLTQGGVKGAGFDE